MTVYHYMSLVFGIILTPILTIFGVIGNLISIIVLVSMIKKNRRKIFSLYLILISLAISDTLILLLNFLVNFVANCFEYIEWSWFFLPYQYQGFLIVTIWPLIMSFQMSSIYFTLLISYDRWRAICQPLKSARSMYSSKLLVRIIVLIFVFCIAYNIPRWFEFKVSKTNFTIGHGISYIKYRRDICIQNPIIKEELRKLNQIKANVTVETVFHNLPYLLSEYCQAYMYPFIKTYLATQIYFKYIYIGACYFLFVFLLPLIFITVCNIQLVLAIRANKRQWTEISRLQKKEMHQTKVPLVIVLLFYILGLPPSFINVLDSSSEYIMIFSTQTELWNSLVSIGNLCVLINSSSNFVIYCLLGKKFRLALVRCLVCGSNLFTRWFTSRRILSVSEMENSSFISRSYYRHYSQNRNSNTKFDRIVEMDYATHQLIDKQETLF
uniref:GCR095 n=1 Tax=Schmidtea mediterranea TaxID=79327 RepID=A0A193KUR2_SCHMD|nr:GCR095 [Schmidtea mediterranea]